jgi:Holliday junction resolvasome RuvABC endonuclease subunit
MGYKYKVADLQPDMTALVSLNQETSATQNPESTFTTGQSWGALRIAKVQADDTKMREYAAKIRKIQTELKVTLSSFPHLDIA